MENEEHLEAMTERRPTAALEDTPVFHPLLLAVCPILGLYAYNVGNVPWTALLRPLIVALVCAQLLQWILWAILRDKHKAGVVASALLLALMWGWSLLETGIAMASRNLQTVEPPVAYGVLGILVFLSALVVYAWNRADKRRALLRAGLFLVIVLLGALTIAVLLDRIYGTVASTFILAFVGLVTGCIVYLVAWRRDFRPWTRTANWFGLILVTLYVALIVFNVPRTDKLPAAAPEMPGLTAQASADSPDIYFILLEGYARCDVLLRLYGHNDLPALEALQDLKMTVESTAFANYPWELQSAISVLNMDYLDHLVPPDSPEDLDIAQFHEFYHRNRFFRTLHDAGYEILAYSPGVQAIEPGPLVDRCLAPPRTPSEFEVVLLQNTACKRLLEVGCYARGRDTRSWQLGFRRARVNYVFDTMGTLAGEPHERPRLVFAHVTVPDPPFIFERKGEPADPRRRRSLEERYLGQLHYVSTRVTDTVQQITERATRPSVILLISAQGPRIRITEDSIEPEALAEHFGVFASTRYPDKAPDAGGPPPKGGSLVNVLRHTLNRVLDADLPLLEDRALLTPMQTPLQSRPVTVPTLEHVVVPALEPR
jgi:hypothetical protein